VGRAKEVSSKKPPLSPAVLVITGRREKEGLEDEREDWSVSAAFRGGRERTRTKRKDPASRGACWGKGESGVERRRRVTQPLGIERDCQLKLTMEERGILTGEKLITPP